MASRRYWVPNGCPASASCIIEDYLEVFDADVAPCRELAAHFFRGARRVVNAARFAEVGCCLCQCFVLGTSDVGWVCKDEPVFLPPRGGLGEACQRWHVAARTAVASRFELEFAGDSASGTGWLEQAALLELESTTAGAGIVAPDQVNLLFRRHVIVGVLTCG